jgi:hypothetical protein
MLTWTHWVDFVSFSTIVFALSLSLAHPPASIAGSSAPTIKVRILSWKDRRSFA